MCGAGVGVVTGGGGGSGIFGGAVGTGCSSHDCSNCMDGLGSCVMLSTEESCGYRKRDEKKYGKRWND